MKTRIFSLLMAALLLLGLTACGAGQDSAAEVFTAGSTKSSAAVYDYAVAEEAPMPEPAEATDAAGYGYADGSTELTVGMDSADRSGTAQPGAEEKIIYSAYAQVETTTYDESIEQLYALIDQCGGYLEGCAITGSDYYSLQRGYSYRSANFTIRVPSGSFSTVLDRLSELGNVPYSNTSSQNISTQYYDTVSRLEAYQVQEKRLLEMMEGAETVEDMLKVEEYLSEVQYQIDSLTTALRGWDSLVNYSTLELYIQEVEDYTEPTPEVQRSYWQKTWDGLKGTLRSVGDFFADLLQWVIAALPVLVLLAAAAAVLWLLIRRAIRRRGIRRRAKRAEKMAAASGDEDDRDI